MRRFGAIVAVVMLMGVMVAPVQAGSSLPESVDRFFAQAGFATDTGYGWISVDIDDGSGWDDSWWVTDRESWSCHERSPGVFPTMELRGKDTVKLSGDFLASDFDACVGSFPAEVSFDLTIEAESVIHQAGHWAVVKGEGQGSTSNYQGWVGEGIAVSGFFSGEAVTGEGYGGWSQINYN